MNEIRKIGPVERLKQARAGKIEAVDIYTNQDTKDEMMVRQHTKEGVELIEKQHAEIREMVEFKLPPVERMKMAHRHDDEFKELVEQYRSHGFGKGGLTRLE